MACIQQKQRRAVENVFTRCSLRVGPQTKYFVGNREVFLLGISGGFGTCSDVMGVDVAVFGNEPNGSHIPESKSCEGAVLLRHRRPDESDSEFYDQSLCLAVEGLRVERSDPRVLRLETTGRIKLYLPTNS